MEGFWNDWGGGRADKEGEFGPSLRTSSHFPTTLGVARALPVPGSTAGIKCIKVRQDPELKESVAIKCRGREPSLNTSSRVAAGGTKCEKCCWGRCHTVRFVTPSYIAFLSIVSTDGSEVPLGQGPGFCRDSCVSLTQFRVPGKWGSVLPN